MMKKYIFFGLILILISGCAGIHQGYRAVQIDQSGQIIQSKKTNLGLIISGEENTKLSSQYFGVIDFTFENLSQDWIRIKSIKIDFGEEKINKNVSFTSGNDLAIWHDSIKKRNIISDFNTESILGAITGFGTALAMGSNDKNIQNVGKIAAFAGAASLTAYEFNKVLDKVENTAIFPETHLLANDFVIPPGLFVKKWLLINSRNHKEIGYISHLFLEYQTEEGKTERLKLQFRNKFLNEYPPKWQKDLKIYNQGKTL